LSSRRRRGLAGDWAKAAGRAAIERAIRSRRLRCIRSSHMRRPIISISCGAPADGDGSALFPCARERRISRLYWWMARLSFMLILVVLAVFQPGIAQVQGRQQVTLRTGFML